MKRLKQRLRTWLDIRDSVTPATPEDYTTEFNAAVKSTLDKLDRSFTQRIARFKVVKCIVCGKALIDGRDPIYRDYKGHLFCSHDCIDKYKEVK